MLLIILAEDVERILQGADTVETSVFDGIISFINSLTRLGIVIIILTIIVAVIMKKLFK